MNIKLNKPAAPITEKGFTLLELLVSMTIALVVMAAVYSTYSTQQRSYIKQDQLAGVQQNIRAALYIMTKDIRMAGYDPTYLTTPKRNLFGITVAQTNTLTVTADLDEDGNATDANETMVYSLDAHNDLIRNAGGGDQTLAENIVAIGLAYAYDNNADGVLDVSAHNNIIWAIDTGADNRLDVNLDTNDDGVINAADATGTTIAGTALTASIPITSIRAVKIWLLARTANPISGHTDTNSYVVGNRIITPGGAYMYKCLTAVERCRNL